MIYVVVLCSKGMICLRDLASILLVHKYSTCFPLCDGHFRDFRASFQLVPAGSSWFQLVPGLPSEPFGRVAPVTFASLGR